EKLISGLQRCRKAIRAFDGEHFASCIEPLDNIDRNEQDVLYFGAIGVVFKLQSRVSLAARY
ncbi:MAG TPA: hypothetical protein VK970_22835, partial [Candidatus Methylacidiphilales bacterium]|nr:hypothetical protein [Candidatus Methylacidiphilales bacterium]